MSDAEMLADIQRVSSELGVLLVPVRLYREHGTYSVTAIKKRFGSWNNAIEAAGLESVDIETLSDDDLFDNLREVWIKIGRQPRSLEMVKPLSKYTKHPYKRRFQSWLGAVKAFVDSVEQNAAVTESSPSNSTSTRGSRDPSLRLRFLVMRRDCFKCRHCGRSPATDAAIQLHIDHVVPWANGGKTMFDNLQTLCAQCNLGKSDLLEGIGYHRNPIARSEQA